MKHKILFLDDEEKILFSLKRVFRPEDYEPFYFTNPMEALNFLKANDISVIVSDMKMPEMNGVDFFLKAKKIQPEAIRIILSGYSDAGNIMEALNKGSIWNFISKPWNNDDIKISIRNAVELFEKNRERQELIDALKQKTIELDQLNKSLEQKVKERTWVISERTNILNMLVEDKPIEEVLTETCLAVSKVMKNSQVFIRVLFTGELFSSQSKPIAELPRGYANLEDKIKELGKNLRSETGVGILLEKGDKPLGILMVSQDNPNEKKTIQKISDFISLLNIALFQYSSLVSAPKLIEDIDKLIGSL